MDKKFGPAIEAIKSGEVDLLKSLVARDPSLAGRSFAFDHPTLLQFLVLCGIDFPDKIASARVLIDAGADIDEPLRAAGGTGHLELAELLLDAGANINGDGRWSPLEEALYFGPPRMIDLLISRGASIHNLRIAAGMGRVDIMKTMFDEDGSLKPEAGTIQWPFSPKDLSDNYTGQDVVNNAFIFACRHNRIAAAEFLLDKGAEIDAMPPGFDYRGTGLHAAAISGHREMVDFLLNRGATIDIRDKKVNSTPAGWAEHAGHHEIQNYLESLAVGRA